MAAAAAVFALLFTALGLLSLGFGLRRMWIGHASARWPTTLGEVVFANTEQSSTTFSPRFVYRYEVDGVPHFNNLRKFGRVEGEGEDWAAAIAARYPVGTKVPVAYFSTDPDVAVLEPGNDSEALFLPGVGLVALLLGLGAFVFVVPGVGRGVSPRRLR